MENKKNLDTIDFSKMPDKLKNAIVNLMKFAVSNNWLSNAGNEYTIPWLAHGMGLTEEMVQDIVKDQQLYDERFHAGRIGNPFDDNFIPLKKEIAKKTKNKGRQL